MHILEPQKRNSQLIDQLSAVWEASVKATHLFLSADAIENIKKFVPTALETVPHLIVAENGDYVPVAFMGIKDKKLEMLFIALGERGKGLGKQLILYGIKKFSVNKLAVNEQNSLARGFYEHMGFSVYKRMDFDEQGNPYPLLYMKRT